MLGLGLHCHTHTSCNCNYECAVAHITVVYPSAPTYDTSVIVWRQRVTEIVNGKWCHCRQQSPIILLCHIHRVIPILSPMIFTQPIYATFVKFKELFIYVTCHKITVTLWHPFLSSTVYIGPALFKFVASAQLIGTIPVQTQWGCSLDWIITPFTRPSRGTGYCFRTISFFLSFSATLRENGWTDLHEIFREGVEWPWDDLIKFWANSGKRVGGSKVNLFVITGHSSQDWR